MDLSIGHPPGGKISGLKYEGARGGTHRDADRSASRRSSYPGCPIINPRRIAYTDLSLNPANVQWLLDPNRSSI